MGMAAKKRSNRPRRGGGRGLDIQEMLEKTSKEFHWTRYQYMGPRTHLKKRLIRGVPGISRLDRITKQHDIDYSRARHLRDKLGADRKMINSIKRLPGMKTMTEKTVQKKINKPKWDSRFE